MNNESQTKQQDSQQQQEQIPNKTIWNKISLNSDITLKNFIGCLIHYFMLAFVFVSVDSLQPMLFLKQFNIHQQDAIANNQNVIVIIFDVIVKIITAPIIGYLADRKGRKYINLAGIIIIGVTMITMPWFKNFPFYVFLRCVYAVGAISISVIPLLADYVHRESRGRCAAILVFMSSLGALSSAFINFTILSKLEEDHKIYYQYVVISLLILIIGISYTILCLKTGNSYYMKGQNRKKSTAQLLKVGGQALKHPQISTGFVSAFLARSDAIVLSLFLVLWTYTINHQSGKQDYQQYFKKSSMLSGITYTVIMISCIFYGLLYERKQLNKRNLMIAMLFCAMLGSGLLGITPSTSSYLVYLALIILGIGMSGLLTASLYLINQYSTPDNRGYITGIQTFFGVVGIIFQTSIGALLFQIIHGGPFFYFAGTSFIGIIITFFVYHRKIKKENSLLLTYSQEENLQQRQKQKNVSSMLVQ